MQSKSLSTNKMNLIVVGHVDSGKSTLTYELIDKSGCIDEAIEQEYEKLKENENVQLSKCFWMLNKLKEKQKENLSKDKSFLEFSLQENKFAIADVSGWKEYMRNMISDAIKSHCVLLTVSSTPGEFEAGISKYGGTREHLLLCHNLGVQNIFVCVNKIDHPLVNYSQIRFDEIQMELSPFINHTRYKSTSVYFIPVSSKNGDNIFTKSDKTPWYNGPTLKEALESLEQPIKFISNKPLRISIKDIIEKENKILVGAIESGILRKGMEIKFSFSEIHCKVTEILINNEIVEEALPNQIVQFKIDSISNHDININDIAYSVSDSPPFEVEKFTALINNRSFEKIEPGMTFIFDFHNKSTQCEIVQLKSKLNTKTSAVIEENPKSIKTGESAIAILKSSSPIFCEKFEELSVFGKFGIRDTNQSIGYGVILDFET